MAEVWWTESSRSVRDALTEEDQNALRALLDSLLTEPVPGHPPVDNGLRSLGVLGNRWILLWQEMVDGSITVVQLLPVTSERGG